MKENETEYYLYTFILPQQKIYCAVRSVNGNGFCQCLFVGLICCPNILETNAHTLTLHCVGREIYASKESLYNPPCHFLQQKLDRGNFEPNQDFGQSAFCLGVRYDQHLTFFATVFYCPRCAHIFKCCLIFSINNLVSKSLKEEHIYQTEK